LVNTPDQFIFPHVQLQTFQPGPGLRHLVRHYWYGAAASTDGYDILPDGCVDVVFALNSSRPRLFIYGSTTRNTRVSIDPQVPYFGVRFQPGCFRAFSRIPAHELTDRAQAPRSFCDVSAEQAMDLGDGARMSRFFDQRLSGFTRYPLDARVLTCVRQILRQGGNARVAQLARRSGASLRTLERAFSNEVGMSPKLFGRIARVQSALILMQRQTCLTRIAHELHYFDHAHFAKDFIAIVGVPPSQY
jgi:AraC-like DNA-binding protein